MFGQQTNVLNRTSKLFEPYREYIQYRSNAYFVAYTSTGLEYIHLRI